MKRLLFDTNVVLDVLLDRQPHAQDSARALDLVAQGRCEGFVAAHGITTIFYLLERQLGAMRARALLGEVLLHLVVASVTDAAIRAAMVGPLADFEDGVTHAAALDLGADTIVTRKRQGFRGWQSAGAPSGDRAGMTADRPAAPHEPHGCRRRRDLEGACPLNELDDLSRCQSKPIPYGFWDEQWRRSHAGRRP